MMRTREPVEDMSQSHDGISKSEGFNSLYAGSITQQIIVRHGEQDIVVRRAFTNTSGRADPRLHSLPL